MRWSTCHICGAEDETVREDKSTVKIYECHCCWEEYCEHHGLVEIRICEDCLDDAYITNQYKDDVLRVESGQSESFEVEDVNELFKLIDDKN